MNSRKKRSPLTGQLLRRPGQKLDEDIQKVNYRVLYYVIAFILSVFVAVYEWLKLWRNYPPQPIPLTVFAAGVGVFALFRWGRDQQQLKTMRQGRNGEREVGQLLEKLREKGYRVFHDLPCKNGNIDHVVVSREGIFAVETKAYSKPPTGSPTVTFDGDRITLIGKRPDAKPVQQTRDNAQILRGMLKTKLGKTFDVKGVLIVYKWFVKRTGTSSGPDIWLHNGTNLETIVPRQDISLSEDDFQKVSDFLEAQVTISYDLSE